MQNKSPKKIPQGLIKLQFAGELILPRIADKTYDSLFQRYQILFEMFANLRLEDRLLKYKMINALILTSLAKKTLDPLQKVKLFDLKNEIYLNLASAAETRKKLAFRYLTSKNFRVLNFCSECQKNNSKEELARHKWKFCKNCEVDRDYYNVLSMFHRFDDGSMALFLSNDRIKNLPHINPKNKGKLEEFSEEARYKKYSYSVKNLDAFDIDSVLEMNSKIMKRI